jgi:hypothetical protein
MGHHEISNVYQIQNVILYWTNSITIKKYVLGVWAKTLKPLWKQ